MPSKPRRWHPELDAADPKPAPFERAEVQRSHGAPAVRDIAIDFVDLKAVVDRIHAAFFRNSH